MTDSTTCRWLTKEGPCPAPATKDRDLCKLHAWKAVGHLSVADYERSAKTTLEPDPGWTYILRFADHVKIGMCGGHVGERLSELWRDQGHFEVLAVLHGGKLTESRLHMRFRGARIYTGEERFRPDEDLLAWAAQMGVHEDAASALASWSGSDPERRFPVGRMRADVPDEQRSDWRIHSKWRAAAAFIVTDCQGLSIPEAASAVYGKFGGRKSSWQRDLTEGTGAGMFVEFRSGRWQYPDVSHLRVLVVADGAGVGVRPVPDLPAQRVNGAAGLT